MVRILIDTNILLDYIYCRKPHHSAAEKIISACSFGMANGIVAAHSFTNMFYIMRKDFSSEERKAILLNIATIFEVAPINGKLIRAALENEEFSDLEDCLQDECAEYESVEFIITRDIKGFYGGKTKTLSPEEFVEKYGL